MCSSEDEDSRDSGLGDMDCGPSSLKGAYCGEQLFILDEEMEELNIDETSRFSYDLKPRIQRGRVFSEITNGYL